MKFSIKNNVASVVKDLKRFRTDVPDVLVDEAEEHAEAISRESKRLTPVRTGELKGSHFVRRERESVEVGADADHALVVHEKPGQRGWKFLEVPVARRQGRMKRDMEQSLVRDARKKGL